MLLVLTVTTHRNIPSLMTLMTLTAQLTPGWTLIRLRLWLSLTDGLLLQQSRLMTQSSSGLAARIHTLDCIIWPSITCLYPVSSHKCGICLLDPVTNNCICIIQLATSVDVERVFSRGRLIINHLRSRLSGLSVRALMCLGEWSQMGLINVDDLTIGDSDQGEDADDEAN